MGRATCLNQTFNRLRLLLGLIGGIMLIIAGITTIIPEQGFIGVLFVIAVGGVTLYYAYRLIKSRDESSSEGSSNGE
jgi:hypothetical protein